MKRNYTNQVSSIFFHKSSYTNKSSQIQEFQTEIQSAAKDHEIKEKEWKRQYETTLQTEHEKYDRRLSGFYERMQAKDEEFAKLEESLRETKSAPTSPTSSTFIVTRNNTTRHRFRNQSPPPVVSQEQYDQDVRDLKKKLSDLVSTHQSHIEQLQHTHKLELEQLKVTLQDEHTAQLKQVADALQSEHNGKNEGFISLINGLESEKKSYVEKLAHFDTLKERMDLDRVREFELHQSIISDLRQEITELKEKHRSKILQMNEKFSSSESRLKSLFMNENQQITMHYEASVENLVAENKNAMQELKDTLENEKEVIQIKYQTASEENSRLFSIERDSWTEQKEALAQENGLLTRAVDQANAQKEKLFADYTKFKKENLSKARELNNVKKYSFFLHVNQLT